MTPTPEQVEALANMVVEKMTLEELKQFVFDDIYSIMLEDSDCFESNLETMNVSIDDLVIDPIPLMPAEATEPTVV
jgi:hypothetical protein